MARVHQVHRLGALTCLQLRTENHAMSSLDMNMRCDSDKGAAFVWAESSSWRSHMLQLHMEKHATSPLMWT